MRLSGLSSVFKFAVMAQQQAAANNVSKFSIFEQNFYHFYAGARYPLLKDVIEDAGRPLITFDCKRKLSDKALRRVYDPLYKLMLDEHLIVVCDPERFIIFGRSFYETPANVVAKVPSPVGQTDQDLLEKIKSLKLPYAENLRIVPVEKYSQKNVVYHIRQKIFEPDRKYFHVVAEMWWEPKGFQVYGSHDAVLVTHPDVFK